MSNVQTVHLGDCLEVLRGLPDSSVDSVVTDPPYGLSKEPNIVEVLTKWVAGEPYDHAHGGFMGKAWDSFVPHPDVWKEVFRVLKPGGHALVFAGTRTQDLMTIALRLGGFEIRDVIEWLYFSGFPKSMDVGKAFDKRSGGRLPGGSYESEDYGKYAGNYAITGPATDLARQWDGWGTALKPAHEPIVVARKPFAVTVAANVEQHGTGAINIDRCRIGEGFGGTRTYPSPTALGQGSGWNAHQNKDRVDDRTRGRFPANCVTTDEVEFYSPYFNVTPREVCKKASKADRGAGNTHPTVKPTDLMAWLVRLVTPPGGTVLDPFAGSGSTLVAAKREGFGFIGIEREPEYVEIIRARIGEKEVA